MFALATYLRPESTRHSSTQRNRIHQHERTRTNEINTLSRLFLYPSRVPLSRASGGVRRVLKRVNTKAERQLTE